MAHLAISGYLNVCQGHNLGSLPKKTWIGEWRVSESQVHTIRPLAGICVRLVLLVGLALKKVPQSMPV